MIKSRAFTLMEMLIVLVIIGFILAFIGPRIINQMFRSDVSMTKMKMSLVRDGLIQYKQDMGHFPKKKEGGIQALLSRPNTPGNEKWDGPYVTSEEDLEDKWAEPLELNIPPVKNKNFRFFEIISTGGESEDAKEIVIGA